jgi:hypothetical protein
MKGLESGAGQSIFLLRRQELTVALKDPMTALDPLPSSTLFQLVPLEQKI